MKIKSIFPSLFIGILLGIASTLPGHISPKLSGWLGLPMWGHFFGYSLGPFLVCYLNRYRPLKSWLLGTLTIIFANITYYLLPIALSHFIPTIHLGTLSHMLTGFAMWTLIGALLAFVYTTSFLICQKGRRFIGATLMCSVLLFALYLDNFSFKINMFWHENFSPDLRAQYVSTGIFGRLFIADVIWTIIGLILILGIFLFLVTRTKRPKL